MILIKGMVDMMQSCSSAINGWKILIRPLYKAFGPFFVFPCFEKQLAVVYAALAEGKKTSIVTFP